MGRPPERDRMVRAPTLGAAFPDGFPWSRRARKPAKEARSGAPCPLDTPPDARAERAPVARDGDVNASAEQRGALDRALTQPPIAPRRAAAPPVALSTATASPQARDALERGSRSQPVPSDPASPTASPAIEAPAPRPTLRRPIVDLEQLSAHGSQGHAPSAFREDDLAEYLSLRAVPTGGSDAAPTVAAADPGALARRPLRTRRVFGPRPRIVLAAPRAVDAAIRRWGAARLAEIAATRIPEAESARAGAADWHRAAVCLAAMATLIGALIAPGAVGTAWVAVIAVLVGGAGALRAAIIARALFIRPEGAARRDGGRGDLRPEREAPPSRPPRIALLIALKDEAAAAPILLDALERLDYPRDRLEAKLLVEAEDMATRRALAALRPPDWIEIIDLPPGGPGTKPRALNLALPFVRADLIGIYDAEDRPAPDQLRRVVETFRAAPPETAAVQTRLTYYNPEESWLTRCFTLEYAIWFDLLLPGLRALNLPVPLGGAGVFVRAEALRAVGGWDAHNVTEDADLGMRLHRMGRRVALVDSVTLEEANGRLWPWVRQRSRWIKGYVQTWRAHTRRPVAALRAFGVWGFLGLQLTLLASAVAYLANPFLMATAASWMTGGPGLWRGMEIGVGGTALTAALLLGQAALLLAAVIVVTRRRLWRIAPWILVLPFYWTLGAVAAYKAVFELIAAPSFWDKTRHVIGPAARALQADALRKLRADRRRAAVETEPSPSAARGPLPKGPERRRAG